MSDLIVLLIILLASALYFLPTIVAVSRDCQNKLPIFLLNLLLGATGAGWVGSLIWSFTSSPSSDR
jgi:hypothetical protein